MTNTSKATFRQALSDLVDTTGLTGISTASRATRFSARKTSLDTPYLAAEAAGAALAAGAQVAASIAHARGAAPGEVQLDSRHVESSLLSFLYLRFADPAQGLAPRVAGEDRTAAAGFYPTADKRWVYLHSGFPHNTHGLLNLLGVKDDRKAVTRAVAGWQAHALEQAIADAGLCGAMVRSSRQWRASTAGQLLATRPVVEVIQVGDSPAEPFPDDGDRPLSGTRVLDLTRILAGPTCARTLASYGASVLRIGADHLPNIPLFAVDTGFGKRASNLDLRKQNDQTRLRRLVRQSDVFSQGYRSGAMERLGFGLTEVVRQRPGVVYVSINCYGHEGSWRERPGWEQLAQTVTGMAPRQGAHLHRREPTLLPAAVNDYITGYLAAYGALAALQRRAESGGSYWVRVSLARTAMWVDSLGSRKAVTARAPSNAEISRFSAHMNSAWGPVSYLQPAVSISNTAVGWQRPPSPLGSDPARF